MHLVVAARDPALRRRLPRRTRARRGVGGWAKAEGGKRGGVGNGGVFIISPQPVRAATAAARAAGNSPGDAITSPPPPPLLPAIAQAPPEGGW